MDEIERLIEKKDDEEILFYIRRHFVPLGFQISIAFILLLIPFILMFWLFQFTWGLFVFFLLLGLSFLFLLRVIVIWYYCVFVVTSVRIVDVTQHGFFDRTVSEARHDYITEVFHRKTGFLEHLFSYGTVTVQTYSATLVLKDVYRPGKIQQRIVDAANLKIDGGSGAGPTPRGMDKSSQDIKKKIQKGQELDECELKGIMEFLKERVDKKRLLKEFFEEDLKDRKN